MKKVTRIQTSDGVLHENFEKAFKHADKRYGEALLPLADILARMGKYKDTLNFIDENLDRFEELIRLKRDTVVDPMDKEEEEDPGDGDY